VREAFDPADKELQEFNQAIAWLVREIHLETGLSQLEIFPAIYYLATYGDFEGFGRTDAGPYGGRGLRHLALPFHTLDRNGTTARLWRGLYRNWSIIRTLCEGCLEPPRPTSKALPADMSLAEAPAPAETSKEDHETAGRQSAVNGRHPDGLEGGRWLRWKGKRYNVPTGVIYRLIQYMWDRDHASYDDLMPDSLKPDSVFDTPVIPQTVRSYVNKANNALPPGFPWKLSANATSRHVTKVPKA
jgi:hypothetical protein